MNVGLAEEKMSDGLRTVKCLLGMFWVGLLRDLG